jgi:predicted Zn finger-like uncharacterized protein
MIVICPECQSRYNVPAEVISSEGRTLKCKNCEHKWFHEGVSFQDILDDAAIDEIEESPIDDSDSTIDDKLNDIEEALDEEISEEISIAFSEELTEEPVSSEATADVEIDFIEKAMAAVDEGLKPRVEVPIETKFIPKGKKGGLLLGIVAAITLFFLFAGAGIYYKDYLLYKYPASKKIYTMFEEKKEVPGTGLVFDRTDVSWSDSKLVVHGQVINLQETATSIPMVLLSFLSESGDVLDQGKFSLEVDVLEGEGVAPFSYEIQATPDIKLKTTSIDLSFIAGQDIAEGN